MSMHLRSRKAKPAAGDQENELNVDVAEVEDSDLLLGNDVPEVEIMRGLAGDERNVAVLLFLYVLQGIPLGLGGAVPLILTNLQVSYKQQAEFSFAYWPFSIKLLWAPIVDSCFFSRFGRRKTWLVPVQYLIGATMILLSKNVDFYLKGADGKSPDVLTLTLMFFFLNFLAATQDIAVDGWALTMLQRRNVGYASTCNAVGQTAGYFLGYVGYMALESYGLITLPDFLFFWGCVFVAATTLVALLKHEKAEVHHHRRLEDDEELELGVVDTYKMLLKIVTLPLMPSLIAFLLTSKVGFSAADAVTGLKLIESGFPKDKIALMAGGMAPLQIVLPWLISRYTVGGQPMDVYLRATGPRLLLGLVFAWIVWITPSLQLPDGSFPAYYYAFFVLVFIAHQVFLYSMFVAAMAFFAKISDPLVGGTYMTLLNTLTNLGGNWPATLALWWVDVLTVKSCEAPEEAAKNSTASGLLSENFCENPEKAAQCKDELGGRCVTQVEGYYIESVACVAIGFLWLGLWGWRTAKKLQAVSDKEWRVVKAK